MSADLLKRPENIETLIVSSNYPTGVWAAHPVGAAIWAALHAERRHEVSGTLDVLNAAASRHDINAYQLLKDISTAARDAMTRRIQKKAHRIEVARRIAAAVSRTRPGVADVSPQL